MLTISSQIFFLVKVTLRDSRGGEEKSGEGSGGRTTHETGRRKKGDWGLRTRRRRKKDRPSSVRCMNFLPIMRVSTSRISFVIPITCCFLWLYHPPFPLS